MTTPLPSTDGMRVAVRVRPFSQREKKSGSKCVISMYSGTIQDPKNPEHRKTFTFDLAYWSHDGFQKDQDGVFISADPSSQFASQTDVFHNLGRGILDSAWQGYNTTLLAYGQTGSGKSYSMVGFGANKGIIPKVCEELFQAIEKREGNEEYQVTFSMLEIYNEQIRDLLSRTKKPGGLKVREDQQLGFYVDGLKSVPCENYAQIERLMEQGTKVRTTASTNMNASSSRSHMVITIQFKQDRLILGSNSAYLYIGFPSERGSEDLSRFDYDFFQLERAAAEGVSVDKLGAASRGDGNADPSALAVFQDFVKLMPLVAEANQMGEELEKGLRMELKVKNLASSDSRGYELQKEVMVKVTHQRTHEVWIWSKAKFINRKFLMEELYQRFLEGEDSHVAQEDDPFWDPVEAVHLGSAHVWLQPLAYCMKLEEQVEFLNCDGMEEAVLHIHVTPCFPGGQARGDEDVVMDPLELLGKRMDFQIGLVRCLGIKWLKEGAERGVQMGYRIYDLSSTFYTKPVWKTVNPQIEETVQFTALNASQEFLNYLQTNALIVELWGLQEGCAQLNSSQPDVMVTSEVHIMVDTKKISTMMDRSQTTSNQISELYMKLLKLEQETELLRNVNRALREENVLLKHSLEKAASAKPARKPSDALKVPPTPAQLPSARDSPHVSAQRAGSDRELAMALKVFYQSMNAARGQFLRLRHYKPPDDDGLLRPFVHQQSQRLKDFGELLESSLWRLKSDVARIVRDKRAGLLHPGS
ncbi:LOW QUALITY PROTEIN: kinesin-like protein KIF28P [Lutra lutra]|uniref:LOW QUALITY PROTEIN: kinesin-like protein KIF28P n=1 Tax=Lutra lutra TaxID=9657 RepID=UPI001FD2D683|nr:LOW QUALITY PROTEIN: kinesin-like protein KIF28P [Lutra lutra]